MIRLVCCCCAKVVNTYLCRKRACDHTRSAGFMKLPGERPVCGGQMYGVYD